MPAVVNAFNRADAKGILLHSRVDALGTTVVLKGTLAGTKLSVEIPPLGGGVGAIAEFKTKVSKGGKYIQARCKNKEIKTSSAFPSRTPRRRPRRTSRSASRSSARRSFCGRVGKGRPPGRPSLCPARVPGSASGRLPPG